MYMNVLGSGFHTYREEYPERNIHAFIECVNVKDRKLLNSLIGVLLTFVLNDC